MWYILFWTHFIVLFAGIQAPRVSVVDKGELPNPRLVTSIVHRDVDQPSNELTILIMSWGQFIDHDVALAAPPRGKQIKANQSILKHIKAYQSTLKHTSASHLNLCPFNITH
jgi:hypothetical protein